MQLLHPFSAVFYDETRNGAQLNVAPPYDVVSPSDHKRLLEQSPDNIIRFTLGEQPGKNGDFSNAGSAMRSLLRTGVLKIDPAPRLFLYQADFMFQGEECSFWAVVGVVDLEEDRILFHEKTMPDVKKIRMEALSGTQANIGMILLACRDRGELYPVLERGKGERRFRADVAPGETHSIYALSEEIYPEIHAVTADREAIIADGHHRFQTAQKYWKNNPASAGARFCLVALGSLDHPSTGLLLNPYHRAVSFSDGTEAASWAETVVQALKPAETEEADLTLYYPGAHHGVSLSMQPEGNAEKKSLAAYLHEAFLDPLKGSDGVKVEYVRDITGVKNRAVSGQPVVALELRAVKNSEFVETVRAGEVFPPKSTCFYPKLFSGLIMRFF